MIRMLIVVLTLLCPVEAAAETGYSVITEVNGDSLGVITGTVVDSTGVLWVAAEHGLFRMKDGLWTKIRSDLYESIVLAYDGTLWFSQYNSTLSHYDGIVWSTLDAPDRIHDYGVAPDGTIWVAGIGTIGGPAAARVYRYDGTAWTSFSTDEGLADNRVSRIVVSPTGEVWACHGNPYDFEDTGYYNRGISHYKDGIWRVYNEANGFVNNSVLDFAFLPDSTTVVCYGNPNTTTDKVGIIRWDGNAWSTIVPETFGFLSVDSDGILWVAPLRYILRYDGTNSERIYTFESDKPWPQGRVAKTPDGRIYIGCGYSGQNNGLLVINTITHVDDPVSYPHAFPTLTAYPNPFNPTTTISYTIPASGRVTLTVYSVSGQKVATMVDDMQEAGSHSVVFDGKGLSSGVYLYRLETAGAVKTGRMLMVK